MQEHKLPRSSSSTQLHRFSPTGTLATYRHRVLVPVRERRCHRGKLMHKHKRGITGEAIALQIGQEKLGGLFKPFLLRGRVLVIWGLLHHKTVSSRARLIHRSFRSIISRGTRKDIFCFLDCPKSATLELVEKLR